MHNRSMQILNFAVFLMKSLSSSQTQPFQLLPGQHWHKHANDVDLPDALMSCAQTGPHMHKGVRRFKANFKIIVTIHVKMLEF